MYKFIISNEYVAVLRDGTTDNWCAKIWGGFCRRVLKADATITYPNTVVVPNGTSS